MAPEEPVQPESVFVDIIRIKGLVDYQDEQGNDFRLFQHKSQYFAKEIAGHHISPV